ncbi:cysteine--tRNA ligase [Neoehrlichia mikurensis]|uniref:Cysteine--tRNA ligase n=1 Tax=Neoehrlichia mikurensis TaxID=89586 RepID=A0A9Q9C051_9RICK|nr:cysteine--tRNA ligase [Neoehrlichia mikurensis]QXK92354.1 cysteine--tRNA ligase [Neoehrlichia mikurensis]UTO55963.1 cysteine--tRNA ligase [Neoehrlichia mikurensis]
MKIYDTLRAAKVQFFPLDKNHVKLYVCGPTVYDYAHIGNARSIVVYDVLFRLLSTLYNKVTYVRNITDIDDKIINTAKNSNKTIKDITSYYTRSFHDDISHLNCLSPTIEPKATEKVQVMIQLIERLITSKHAYVKDGTVYFNIQSYKSYGQLSKRNINDMIYGNRVNIDTDKIHPGDFVLWKPATELDISLMSYWPSPWGLGRPGWHIECSAMSYDCLGEDFDIHGGGADLQFPHHENEIAQSCCIFPNSKYAVHWIHNGFLTVNGEKMSKSLGNIVTVRSLLDNCIKGEVIRYVFLSTHYRKPLDWNEVAILNAGKALNRIYSTISCVPSDKYEQLGDDIEVHSEIIKYLKDDMNTPKALSVLYDITTRIHKTQNLHDKCFLVKVLKKSANFLGIAQSSWEKWFSISSDSDVEKLIQRRSIAKKQKDFETADSIRKILSIKGIVLSDDKDGSTKWYKR